MELLHCCFIWNYYSGSGFSTKLNAAGDLSFTGTINSGNVTPSIGQGTANNFNLIGNPFTAFVNLGTFFTDNNGKFTEATIWMWNKVTSTYD